MCSLRVKNLRCYSQIQIVCHFEPTPNNRLSVGLPLSIASLQSTGTVASSVPVNLCANMRYIWGRIKQRDAKEITVILL